MAEQDTQASQSQAPPAGAVQVTRRALSVLLLLLIIGCVNYLDRVLPAILAEPIKHDLALSDTELGVVNGFGFLLIYAAASLPLAQMSDRGRYGLVITCALSLWSAMTALGAFVASGWQLMLSRMGVAVGEAAGMPASHAFITRNFPQDRQTAAISVFNLSLPLGSMAGFAIGGVVGQAIGWRQTFLAMGLFGLALAATAWFVMPRGTAQEPEAARQANLSLFGFVPLLRKKSLVLILIGSALLGTGGYTATAFTPAFLMRSHDLSLAEAGLRFGIAGGIAAAVSLLLIGWLADRLSRRDPRWLPGSVAIMVLLALPFSLAALHLASANLAILALAINYVVPVAYSAPAAVALHRLAPLELRARMSAMLLLVTGLCGGFGPLIAGAISDYLTPTHGAAALGLALHIVPLAYLVGGLCYLAAMRHFPGELDANEPH